jgi:Zn-dependent peptidase ImmA (M78 family)/DNA-binding XRE family transcriptional regulator
MNLGRESFFGERLKIARKMAGMSLQDLADNLQNVITKQALNKYEMGLMYPSSELILSLSEVLDLKPDFFLRKEPIKINELKFRSRMNLPKKIEDSILEKARFYVERFIEIEQILGIENVFTNPIESYTIITEKDAEEAAMHLRTSWELGLWPIANVVEMIESKGVKVLFMSEMDNVDGFSFYVNDAIPVLVINSQAKSISRIRFTIIHELAHLLLNFAEEILADSKLIEKLCHYFSSCFLLPTIKLISKIGGMFRNYIKIEEFIQIKVLYGISIRAIIHRCEKLGIISYDYYKRWMVYLNKQYGSKDEPGEYKGVEKPILFESLVNRAFSENFISMSKAASLLNKSIEELRKGDLCAG